MKTVAFLSHHKSLKRIIPDVTALRILNVRVILVSDNKSKCPDYIDSRDFFQADLNNIEGIAKTLADNKVEFLTSVSDHLLINVVKICELLRISSPCDINTAELFVNKNLHIEHAINHGLEEHVPKRIFINNYEELNQLPSSVKGAIFIKPDIGCGMRGIFESEIADEYVFEYKGLRSSQDLLDKLSEYNLKREFLKYCTAGYESSYYYPAEPRALIQELYHTNKSYTFQYSILNGEWHYNTIGQVFYWLQPSELENNQKITPLLDPRLRTTDGNKMYTEEVGYYHLNCVPEHIFSFFKKCVNYMKESYSINNMGLTLAIHETIDGKFLLTDLNPRVGGQWTINYQFSQPDFYLKYWNSIINKTKETFSHAGPLGCVNPIFMDPGIIESCVIPEDSEKCIITNRNKLTPGSVVPEIQSMNSKKWEVKVYTCGNTLDEQIENVLNTTKSIRDGTAYRK